MKIALILTCYNRREKTINCINKLLPQLDQTDYEYKIYICDDKSTDGTYEALKELLPNHDIIQSQGNLYWSKGMHLAMSHALRDEHDFYLMVNDDVDFEDNALSIMLQSYYAVEKNCGIVGATKAMDSEECTYGGRDENSKLILPGENRECVWANWNCFLVDKEIISNVGIIDGKYQHAWGDYDYSIRMRKKGFSIYTAFEYIGRCDRNSIKGSYRDYSLSRKERLKKMFSPKGVPFYSFMKYHIMSGSIIKLPLYLYGYCSIVGYILLGKKFEE